MIRLAYWPAREATGPATAGLTPASPLDSLENRGMDAEGYPAGGMDASKAGTPHRRQDSRPTLRACIQARGDGRAPGEEEEAAGMPLQQAVSSRMREPLLGAVRSRGVRSKYRNASSRDLNASSTNGQPMAAAYSQQQPRRNEAVAYSQQQPSKDA